VSQSCRVVSLIEIPSCAVARLSQFAILPLCVPFGNSPVDKALQQVQSILGTAKNPRLAEDCPHKYEDKYALAEYVTNSGIAAVLHVLERFGLDSTKLQTLLQWVQDEQKTVTLSFRMEDRCALERESEVEQVVTTTTRSPQINVTTETTTTSTTAEGPANDSTTTTSISADTRMVHKIKQYHWQVNVNYALAVYPGNDTTAAIELQARNMTRSIVTSGGLVRPFQAVAPPQPPIVEHTIHNPLDVDITWIFTVLNRQAGVCQFAIDKSLAACKTPRRNPQVEQAVEFQHQLQQFANRLKQLLSRRLEREIMSKHNPAPSLSPGSVHPETLEGELLLSHGTNAEETIFHPILPLMENGTVLPPDETGALLDAHSQSMDQMLQNLAQVFPDPKKPKLATTAEAGISLLCHNLSTLCQQYLCSINYVEGLLTQQLTQAIGKAVGARELDQFLQFHNQKLFAPAYAPRPFTYAIRRPNHFPDGMLSIEAKASSILCGNGDHDAATALPIDTMVRHVSGHESPISMPINAGTSIDIGGDRFLHGWVKHSFESEAERSFQIVARARQFSSFLLVLGKMAGKNKFAPKHALILRNKDEVLIPLLTEVLPTAKEFKDAISSLSPEQQAFCKAYRGMQLESSVFGICIIQIKPQLEKLLNLPDGALTKEIQLTEDLMSLFVEYQIPSDLMSFEGDTLAQKGIKLAAVKGHVKAVQDAVNGTTEKQLMQEEMKKEMREAQQAPHPFGPPPPGAGPGSLQVGGIFGSGAVSPSAMMSSFGGIPERKSKAFSPAPPPPPSAPVPLPAGGRSHQSRQQDETSRGVDAENPTDNAEDDAGLLQDDADDFTLIPKMLDGKVEKLDSDDALKSTILKAGQVWSRTRQENLLTPPVSASIDSEGQRKEKDKAFDLLDALSRSGTLSIDCAELHVIVALTHCFENDVMGTVIQDNINPISKAERSALIVGSTIHDEPCQILLQSNASQQRLEASFPALFADEDL